MVLEEGARTQRVLNAINIIPSPDHYTSGFIIRRWVLLLGRGIIIWESSLEGPRAGRAGGVWRTEDGFYHPTGGRLRTWNWT